ncbi:HPP family protein [Sphingomonas sp. NCPPB 2930]|uniref:HPP family protein n=1 Tax=unclassified Sphingomonas TaxID=196159 RepID=UPI002865EF98|nr:MULTISPECIES: HPP family protein [unclassified Sphingomonas]MDR6113757.1 CBS domain-containing membrane protein [Sphingomonas sp. SORGH_AS_0789]MDR6145136.1 CBS domain-containing membrane protein [Sphingomonas sp. SORGH_AS_0870]MDR6148883.1 CBS domain-containing membrane protein [Sphingomonas sp. SORGH_AS_0742]
MRFFQPLLAGATLSGRLLACIGAVIGIALTIIVCGGLPPLGPDLPIIVAPLGASAVLVFAVPASPLAQPWSVVGGNVLSTLVGVAMFHAIPSLPLAAGCAVGGAILVMSLARCLHPPGGAAALTAVIGSQGIHAAGFSFAFAPVAINSIALVALGMFFHRATGRSYPHEPGVTPPAPAAVIRPEDVEAALADMHESFDIAREDLDMLLAHAERHARART